RPTDPLPLSLHDALPIFAVEAEVHVCKIFPGGRFSDLIEALDHAIGEGIDVVSLGLACRHPSQLVAAKIDQARNAGVACVVAARSEEHTSELQSRENLVC